MSWTRPKMSEVTRAVNSTVWDNQTDEALSASILKAKAITDEGADVYVYGTMASNAAPTVPPIVTTPALIRSFNGEHEVLIGKQGTDDPGNTTGGGTDPGGGGDNGGGGTTSNIVFLDMNPAVGAADQSGSSTFDFVDTSDPGWPSIDMPLDSSNRLNLTAGRRLWVGYNGQQMSITYGTYNPDFLAYPKLRLVFTVPNPAVSGGIFTGDDSFHIWWDADYNRILIGNPNNYASISAPFDVATNTDPWCISIDQKGAYVEIKFGTYSGTITDDPVTTAAAEKYNYTYPLFTKMWVSTGMVSDDMPALPLKLHRFYGYDLIDNNKAVAYMTNTAQYLAVPYHSAIVKPAFGTIDAVTNSGDWPQIDLSSKISGKIYDILKVDAVGTDGVEQYVVITYTDTTIFVYTTQYFSSFVEVYSAPYKKLGSKIDVHSVYHGMVMNIFSHDADQPNTAHQRLIVMTFYGNDIGDLREYTEQIDLTQTLSVGYSTTLPFSTNAATTIYKDPTTPYRVIVYRMTAVCDVASENTPNPQPRVVVRILTVDFVANDYVINDVSDRTDELTMGAFIGKHVECHGISCKDNTGVLSLSVADNAAYLSTGVLYMGAFNVYLQDWQALRNAMLFGDSDVLQSTGYSLALNARSCDFRIAQGVTMSQQFECRTMVTVVEGRSTVVDTVNHMFYNYSTGRLADNYLPAAVGFPGTMRGNSMTNDIENQDSASARLISVNDDCTTLVRNRQLDTSRMHTAFKIPLTEMDIRGIPDSTIGETGGYQVFVRFQGATELNHSNTQFTPGGGVAA